MSIRSTMSIAESVSGSFSQSASLLNSINVSLVSTRINVAGNASAEESMALFQSDLKRLSNSIVSTGNTIHSVAKEFECIDQKIAQLPISSLPGGIS